MRPQNGLLYFLGKETHSEIKSWKSSRIPTKKVTTTTVNPGNRRGFCVCGQISSIFHCSSFFVIFLFLIFFIFSFFHFFHFSLFFPFFQFFKFSLFLFFSFSSFPFLSFFRFLHFSVFSVFFLFLCLLLFWVLRNPIFFWPQLL